MRKLLWLAAIASAMLLVGIALFGRPDEQAVGSYRLLAPTRVGVAYPTPPPPFASLDNILGSKPSLDELDLYARSFAKIVFSGQLPGSSPRYHWITKWTDTVEVSFSTDDEPRYKELWAQVVGDLSNITGLPFLAGRPYEIAGVLQVRITSMYGERLTCGLFEPGTRNDGSIFDLLVVATPALEGLELQECFYEKISQALGLYGDTALIEESMFRSREEDGRWPRPTWHDVIILRTLYDPRIKPGMHRRQAMPIAREIIAELLEELNAPAE